MAMYDVVVADARAPRDGRFIEKIGTYNPNTNPATIDLKEDRALEWVMTGAQPSDTARAILSHKGVMLKKHLQVGVNKGAITQEQADAKFEEWKASKGAEIQGKVDSLAKKKASDAKARLDAEAKVNAARAEAIQAKQVVEEPVAQTEEAETSAEVAEEVVETKATTDAAEEVVEAAVEETVAEETVETPAEEAPEAKEEEAPAAEAPVEEEKKEEK